MEDKSIGKVFEDIKRLDNLDDSSLSDSFLKLSEEIGELANAINKFNGRKNSLESKEEIILNIKEEIADSIQNLILISTRFGFDHTDIINEIFKKNKKWEKVINNRNNG
jgi:NTP pyrophosphatase (non-canonical NTP hydrolase)